LIRDVVTIMSAELESQSTSVDLRLAANLPLFGSDSLLMQFAGCLAL
jgi:hypothetical protein